MTKIKSHLTTSFLMFTMEFADPSTTDKAKIESEMGFPIADVFNSQRLADKAKKVLTKDQFAKMLGLYFHAFNNAEGLDYARLEHEMHKNKKHMLRHLGKDKIAYLELIASLTRLSGSVRKGLIFEAS